MNQKYLESQNNKFLHLNKQLGNTTQNLQGLESLVIQLKSVISEFSQKLQQIGGKFVDQINQNGESETMICSFQQLSNYLYQISHQWIDIANNLTIEVLDPFKQFIGNYKQTNRRIILEGKKNIKEMDDIKDSLQRAQMEYYRLMGDAEKSANESEKMIDDIDKGKKSKQDFLKLMEKSMQQRQSADEAEKDYHKLVLTVNSKWIKFEEQKQSLFMLAQLNEENRINFSKSISITVIKTLAHVLEKKESLSTVYSDKFKDIDQKQQEESQVTIQELIEKMDNHKGGKKLYYQSILITVIFKKEEFISFEQQKFKGNESNTQSKPRQLNMGSLNEQIQQQENNLIDLYIESLVQDAQSNQMKPLNSVQLQKVKQALQKQNAWAYFTDNLILLYQKSKCNKYHFQLNEDSFNELSQIFRNWTNQIDLNDKYDCGEVYKLMQISIKFTKKNLSKNLKKINLAQTLSDLELWKKIKRWEQLFQYLCATKLEEKKKEAKVTQAQTDQTGYLSKGIGLLGKSFKQMIGQQNKIQVNETEIVYLILEEINFFLISVQLPSNITSEIILNLALNQKIVQLDKSVVQKLIESQENRNNSQLRRSIHSGIVIKINKDNKYITKQLNQYQNKVIRCIKLALEYLEIKDQAEKLLLINSQFNQMLKNKIMKFYLLNTSILYDEKTHEFRNNLIIKKFQIDRSDISYLSMKSQVGIEITSNQKMMSINQSIYFDVKRSLHLHQNKINSNILQSLLMTYAYFHPDISYAQGMNYIAGYLFLTLGDQILSYQVFDKMMNQYFRPVFLNDFENLKQKFYQFNRMFTIFLPELAEYFKQEKVDPQYYAASWFITVFSSVFQYSEKSALINIIWDIFIAESWKGFYKVVFYILYVLQPQLIKMEFEEILHYLCEVVKSEIFQIQTEVELIQYIHKLQGKNDIVDLHNSLKSQILKKFKITNTMINSLENEYKSFILNFNQKLNEYQKRNEKK